MIFLYIKEKADYNNSKIIKKNFKTFDLRDEAMKLKIKKGYLYIIFD